MWRHRNKVLIFSCVPPPPISTPYRHSLRCGRGPLGCRAEIRRSQDKPRPENHHPPKGPHSAFKPAPHLGPNVTTPDSTPLRHLSSKKWKIEPKLKLAAVQAERGTISSSSSTVKWLNFKCYNKTAITIKLSEEAGCTYPARLSGAVNDPMLPQQVSAQWAARSPGWAGGGELCYRTRTVEDRDATLMLHVLLLLSLWNIYVLFANSLATSRFQRLRNTHVNIQQGELEQNRFNATVMISIVCLQSNKLIQAPCEFQCLQLRKPLFITVIHMIKCFKIEIWSITRPNMVKNTKASWGRCPIITSQLLFTSITLVYFSFLDHMFVTELIFYSKRRRNQRDANFFGSLLLLLLSLI